MLTKSNILQFIKTHEKISASLIFSLLIFVFLFKGIFNTGYFAPVDVLRGIEPFMNGSIPHNSLIGDIAWQFLPWFKLSKELISQGHFPFWNIYSGGGLPLFANIQSAILFPLSWFFYILNFKIALLLYSFLKLLLVGLFTFCFLKELKLSYFTSILGATAFMFAGVNVVWLLWPLSSVIIFLPLALFLIERYFNSEKIKYLVLLSFTIAFAIFAGHPQTFFYIFSVIVGYFVYKLLLVRMKTQIPFGRYFHYGFFFAIGILLSSIVLIPFLEYLKLSQNLLSRQNFLTNPFFLNKALFITNFIPDFFGNPAFRGFSYLTVPNYSEITMGYVGISLLLLALYGLFVCYKNKTVIFFTLVNLISLSLIYHINPIYDLINKLPGFSVNYNNRLLYLWAFGVVILGSYGIEAIIKKFEIKKIFLSSTIFFSLFIGLFILNKYQTKFYPTPIKWESINLWQNLWFFIFFVNFIIILLILFNLQRKYIKVILFLLIFLETGVHGIIFNTVTKPEDFFPNSKITTFLQTKFQNGYDKVFSYGHILLPNLGTWYKIDQFADYDAMYLKSNKQLKTKVANFNSSPEYTFQNPNLNALSFLGVKYLIYPQKEGEKFIKSNEKILNLIYKDDKNTVLQLKNVFPRAYSIQAKSIVNLQQKLKGLIQNGDITVIQKIPDFQLLEDGESILSYSTPSDTYLILNENYFPGWRAVLDNYKNLKIENVFGLKVIFIPKGEHSLQIFYYPKSTILGAILSLLSLILLMLFIIRSRLIPKNTKKILNPN